MEAQTPRTPVPPPLDSLPRSAVVVRSTGLPARARLWLLLAGVLGVISIVVGSLIGPSQRFVRIDKVIHFWGYGTLAFVFVLALRPILVLPALAGLVAMGFGIEYVQSWTGRTFDMSDETANAFGVAAGAAAALVVRGAYALIGRWSARSRSR